MLLREPSEVTTDTHIASLREECQADSGGVLAHLSGDPPTEGSAPRPARSLRAWSTQLANPGGVDVLLEGDRLAFVDGPDVDHLH